MKIIRLSLACLCLLLLCSCATTPPPTAMAPVTELPAPVTMNKGAGRGGGLIVTLRLDNGEKLPFSMDTGSPVTFLPKTLVPELGKRLGFRLIWMWRTLRVFDVYAAPKLYLGKTPLVTGSRVAIWDNSKGILGMDCLRHYCVQLDFAAGKIRFLNPDHLDTADLGEAFPLAFQGNLLPLIRRGGLLGERASMTIDTGNNLDGSLDPRLLRRKLRE